MGKPGSTSGGLRPAISKTAYQIVKGSNDHEVSSKSHSANGESTGHNVTFASGTSSSSFLDHTNRLDAQREKFLEDEIMGDTHHSGQHQKSDAMQKNLDQMVKVLNSRLTGLREAAITRLKLCEEDLDPKSTRMSKHAPKIVDEFDEAIPKSTRDTKYSSNIGTTTSNNNNSSSTAIGK